MPSGPRMKLFMNRFVLLAIVTCSVLVIYVKYGSYAYSKASIQTSLSLHELRQVIHDELRQEALRQQVMDAGKRSGDSEAPVNEVNRKTNINAKQTKKQHTFTDKRHKNKIRPAVAKLDNSDNVKDSRVLAKQKYIVYLCDDVYPCAGWGDRQRGVVSAYLLSVVTDRQFIVNMTSPCDVRTFLEPNKYKWDISSKALAHKTNISIGGVRATKYHKVFRYDDVNKVYDYDIIYLRSNSDLLTAIKMNPHYSDKIPDWAKTPRHITFRDGWNRLMRPTDHIKGHLSDMLKGVNLAKDGSLVCAHVRIGQNPSLPNDSRNRNNISTIGVLWDFLESYMQNGSRLFIASDSLDVRALAKLRFGKKVFDSGGVILHIDRQRGSGVACNGFETVILDQLVLTKCHVLVVSASNFSIRAAFLRQSRKNVFMFKNASISRFDFGN